MIQRYVSDLMLSLCPAVPEGWLGEAGCILAEQGSAAAVPLLLGVVLAGALLVTAARRVWHRDLSATHAFLYSNAEPPTIARASPPEPGLKSTRTPAAPVSGTPRSDENDTPPPPEGTLQLLPGRLEVTTGAGGDGPREIRFVRVPGTPPEVTFGRTEGPAHRHIRLASPTVSRLHARMRFDGGRWHIENRSTTNPTRVNGRPLDAAAGEAPLGDGDRIEMGEVGLIFRQEECVDRLPLRSSWHTDRGRRPSNQDAVAVRTLEDGRELAVVCDGMGGHQAGALASHAALDAFVTRLEEGGELEEAAREANLAVRARAAEDPTREGMGTTLVALLRNGGEYRIANVGDSRAYRIDAQGIRPLTADHSFVTEAVRGGRMTKEEAERSPWRTAVTRYLGGEGDVDVDIFGPFSAKDDHLVLLCSDGLHGVLSDEALEELTRKVATVRDLAEEAAEAALRRGGDDNVSVAALQFGSGITSGALVDDRG